MRKAIKKQKMLFSKSFLRKQGKAQVQPILIITQAQVPVITKERFTIRRQQRRKKIQIKVHKRCWEG